MEKVIPASGKRQGLFSELRNSDYSNNTISNKPSRFLFGNHRQYVLEEIAQKWYLAVSTDLRPGQ